MIKAHYPLTELYAFFQFATTGVSMWPSVPYNTKWKKHGACLWAWKVRGDSSIHEVYGESLLHDMTRLDARIFSLHTRYMYILFHEISSDVSWLRFFLLSVDCRVIWGNAGVLRLRFKWEWFITTKKLSYIVFNEVYKLAHFTVYYQQ